MSQVLLDSAGAWSAPIAPDRPCGEAARGDDAYERLRAEVGKLGTLTGGAPAWDQVASLSVDILTRKSKDLTVASYLCAALLEQHGEKGLLVGLTLFRDLIATYWPDLFPELARVRGRIGAVSWLTDQLGRAIGRYGFSDGATETLAKAEGVLGEIDALLAERLGSASPGVGSLRQAVRESGARLRMAAAPTPAPTPTPSAPAGVTEPVEVGTDRDAQRALRAVAEQLSRVAAFRRNAKLTDPSAYRLRRVAEWLEVERLPKATEGKTQVTFPRGLKERVDALLEARNFEGLVVAAEKGLSGDAIFWLDLQWQVAHALRQLGPDYEGARTVVCGELGAVLRRLPGLDTLAFGDGTPFASEQTRAWRAAEVSGGGASGPAPVQAVRWVVPEGAAEEAAALESVFEQAKTLGQAGKLGDALELLAAQGRTHTSRRARFIWRMAMARLLLEQDRADIAKGQLEGLDDELGGTPACDWDLPLHIAITRALLDCHQRIGERRGKQAPEGTERIRSLYDRLARLDPTVALGVKSPG